MYTEQQIREAFWTGYLDREGTLTGVEDAYVWWRDPLLKCAIQDAGRKGATRCKAPCEFCKKRST